MSEWKIPPQMDLGGVVFDMDGLMLDTERVIKYSWEIMGSKLGYSDFGENIQYTLGRNREWRNRYFVEKYGEDFPLQEFLDGYHQIYYEYEREHGIPKKKGLLELLELLKEKQIPMAVATSTHQEHSVPELKRQGIFPYFDVIVTGNMVERGKPDPEIYRTACEKLGVLPEKALALEDSYSGIRSAYQAGMKVVMIPDLLTDDEPVRECLYGRMESLSMAAKWIQKEI